MTLVRIQVPRKHPDVYLGANPRGLLALFKIAQRVVIKVRDYVNPDDDKALAEPVLAHRRIISLAP